MSTPTPAPALTDEQIDSSPADDAQIDDDVRALVEGESMPEETAWAIIAAVIARAKREAAEEIADELNRRAMRADIDRLPGLAATYRGLIPIARKEATNDSH